RGGAGDDRRCAAGRAFLRGSPYAQALSQRLLRAAGVGLAQPWRLERGGITDGGRSCAGDLAGEARTVHAATARRWRQETARRLCGGTEVGAGGEVSLAAQALWRSAKSTVRRRASTSVSSATVRPSRMWPA